MSWLMGSWGPSEFPEVWTISFHPVLPAETQVVEFLFYQVKTALSPFPSAVVDSSNVATATHVWLQHLITMTLRMLLWGDELV